MRIPGAWLLVASFGLATSFACTVDQVVGAFALADGGLQDGGNNDDDGGVDDDDGGANDDDGGMRDGGRRDGGGEGDDGGDEVRATFPHSQ